MYGTKPSTELVEALKASFSESELHCIAVQAERPDNKGMAWAERLSKAARQAASATCADCRQS